jgi:hypothetical protein
VQSKPHPPGACRFAAAEAELAKGREYQQIKPLLLKAAWQGSETMLLFSTMANDKTGTCHVFIFGPSTKKINSACEAIKAMHKS